MSHDGMDFSEALTRMKAGEKVARAGWNGKGMWIALTHGCPQLASSQFWNPHARQHAEQNGGKAEVAPYFVMRDAAGRIVMGWLASQTDMVSDDWEVV